MCAANAGDEMSEVHELRQRVAMLERVVGELAAKLDMAARLTHQTAQTLNANAKLVSQNFRLVCRANNSLAAAIKHIGGQVDEADWWKQGGDDAEGDD